MSVHVSFTGRQLLSFIHILSVAPLALQRQSRTAVTEPEGPAKPSVVPAWNLTEKASVDRYVQRSAAS